MAAAAASASMEGLKQEKSSAKRKRMDSVEAAEGLEHENSAAVEEEKGGFGLSVDEDEKWETPYKGECSVDEYENWVGPFKPAVIHYRNDKELARLRRIIAAENQAKNRDDDEEQIED